LQIFIDLTNIFLKPLLQLIVSLKRNNLFYL